MFRRSNFIRSGNGANGAASLIARIASLSSGAIPEVEVGQAAIARDGEGDQQIPREPSSPLRVPPPTLDPALDAKKVGGVSGILAVQRDRPLSGRTGVTIDSCVGLLVDLKSTRL